MDPGTYTYIGEPAERSWFRGSAAHNTVRINGLDQGRAAGPFRWASKPKVTLLVWEPRPEGGSIEAVCRYEGFAHWRRVVLEAGRLLVMDDVQLDEGQGPEGEHVCEQIWQLGPGAAVVDFTLSAPSARVPSQYSPAYGAKCAGESLIAKVSGRLPLRVAMVVETGGSGAVCVDDELVSKNAQQAFSETRGGGTAPR